MKGGEYEGLEGLASPVPGSAKAGAAAESQHSAATKTAAGVYLVDVRPKLLEIQGKSH